MKTFLLQFFTWWSGVTLGTRFHTWRHGERVGEDQFGNCYYQTRGGVVDPAIGIVRRWVVFAGATEATATPPAGTPGCGTMPMSRRAATATRRASGRRNTVPT